jgi:multidrug resistance efflux pump
MAWLRKVRPLLFVLGGLVLIGSLLGARLLTHGGGGGTTDPVKPATPATGKEVLGTIFIGYADSNPSPIGFGLSPVLQSGEIVKMFVESGQEVKVRDYRLFGGKMSIGDPLYKFNSQMLEAKLVDAQRGVDVAVANLRKARALLVQHKTNIDSQKLKIDVAKDKENRTLTGYQLYESNFRDLHKSETEARIKELLKNDPEFFKIETAYRTAVLELRYENKVLADLESADMGAAVAIAEAEIRRVEALVDEARTAVDMCTVRTKVNGTIERINFSPGDVIGISTRLPVMILVPAGPRIVRAEIEADFAHRVGRDKIGKEVTIYDNTDPKITYKGKVERIGDTFLPKRSSAESLTPSDTWVLEAVIIVENAHPAGVPPLRVRQKVRVNFGQ